jgi:hypothetical protein
MLPIMAQAGVKIVGMGKDRFYAEYDGPMLAIVFIGAIHSCEEVMKDIAWARKLMTPLVGGHDFGPKLEGVVRAVGECFGADIQTRESAWLGDATLA